jgi:hypothetical protein
MKNEPMRGVQELKYRELFTSLSLSFVWTDPAPGGVYVFLSKQLGFQPGPSNQVFFGNTNSITLPDVLDYPATYYASVAGFDVWGPDELVYSPQYRIDTTNSDDSYILPPITDSMLHASLSSRIDEIDGGQEAGFGTGLQKQWTCKIDPGGGNQNYVAGFGLAYEIPEQGPATSEFLVLAHRFGVAAPGAETFGFLIEAGQNGSVVRMDGAKIADASILNASIRNAAVDTLKIADAAVTAQYISVGVANTNTGAEFMTVNSVTIPNLTQGTLRVDWQIFPYIVAPPATTNYDREIRITVDNNPLVAPYDRMVADRWDDNRSIWRNQWGYNGLIYVTGLSVGVHFVKIQIRGWPNGVQTPHTIDGSILTITEAKK